MNEKKIKTLQTRVTEKDYETILQKANELNLSISDYIRLICLKAKINVIVDYNK